MTCWILWKKIIWCWKIIVSLMFMLLNTSCLCVLAIHSQSWGSRAGLLITSHYPPYLWVRLWSFTHTNLLLKENSNCLVISENFTPWARCEPRPAEWQAETLPLSNRAVCVCVLAAATHQGQHKQFTLESLWLQQYLPSCLVHPRPSHGVVCGACGNLFKANVGWFWEQQGMWTHKIGRWK